MSIEYEYEFICPCDMNSYLKQRMIRIQISVRYEFKCPFDMNSYL